MAFSDRKWPAARTLRWRALDEWPGREHAAVRTEGERLVVESVLAGENEDTPFGIHYMLEIDPGWEFRRAAFRRVDGAVLTLEIDLAGNWLTNGLPRDDLSGALTSISRARR